MLLTILEIVVSVILICVILVQTQGSGISSGAFGGGGGEFYRSRRSFEKILIWITIISAVIFGVVSVLLLVHL